MKVPALPYGLDAVHESFLIDWQRGSKFMDLQSMCEAMEVDYVRLVDICSADVANSRKEDDRLPFSIALNNHLNRVAHEARKNGKILLAYK